MKVHTTQREIALFSLTPHIRISLAHPRNILTSQVITSSQSPSQDPEQLLPRWKPEMSKLAGKHQVLPISQVRMEPKDPWEQPLLVKPPPS